MPARAALEIMEYSSIGEKPGRNQSAKFYRPQHSSSNSAIAQYSNVPCTRSPALKSGESDFTTLETWLLVIGSPRVKGGE